MRLVLALALTFSLCSCWFREKHDGVLLLEATQSPTAGMIVDAGRVVAACPSLLDHADSWKLFPAQVRAPSLDAQRELAATQATEFHVEIVSAYPGNERASGEHCYYQVASGPEKSAVVVNKTACSRLCDANNVADYRLIPVQ